MQSAIRAENNEKVSVAWKKFDKAGCKTYLGRDVLAEGYVPMQMTIRNDSNEILYLSPENFNIPLASVHEVSSKVHTSTATRIVAWGVPGLFIWPFLIPAVYDGVKSSEANDALDTDYQSKALKEQLIQPRSTYNAVVFVPKNQANQPIEMFLVNQKTHDKVVISKSSAL